MRTSKKETSVCQNQIVFVFQMPLLRKGRILDYSRWQQNLIGILQPDIAHQEYEPADSKV